MSPDTQNAPSGPSMMGKWNYQTGKDYRYGDDTTYRVGMEYLRGKGIVEDWGCGGAYGKRFIADGGIYRGVDGSEGFADVIADLTQYRSDVPYIFMRHVLEHNHEWKRVLDNALCSFSKKMVLIIFTPFREMTQKLGETFKGVPDIAFSFDELVEPFSKLDWSFEEFKTQTQFGQETVFFISRSGYFGPVRVDETPPIP